MNTLLPLVGVTFVAVIYTKNFLPSNWLKSGFCPSCHGLYAACAAIGFSVCGGRIY
jgi:hypothetical protein